MSARVGQPFTTIRERARRRTVETAAATITLVGAGSEESESSAEEGDSPEACLDKKSKEVNSITTKYESPAGNNNADMGIKSLTIHSDTEDSAICDMKYRAAHACPVSGPDEDCTSVATVGSSDDGGSATINHGQAESAGDQMRTSQEDRFNPFNRDDLSEVVDFEQATRLPAHRRKFSEPCRKSKYSDFATKPDRHNSFTTDSLSDLTSSWDQNRHSKITNAELGLAEDHFSQPEGHFGLSTLEELELAIRSCQALIFKAPEHSERRKSLVHKLVQLRLKRQEAKEGPIEEEPDIKCVVGHRFRKKDSKSSKHYCEKCSNVIWGVVQVWYRCAACGFCCHAKCLNMITRTCASSKVADNTQYILAICPEKGLASQAYRCAECRSPLAFKPGVSEPRQCDYTGYYYCDACHWNDLMTVPARVLHNWDLEQRKVCRASKQFLRLMLKRPVLRINDINPMLFSFVEELNEVKKLREEILIMKRYFVSCKLALESKLLLQLQDRQHFVDNSDMYSLQDLVDTAFDVLLSQLAKIHSSFAQHIKTDCHLCQAKGYICELCNEKEVLFPFDNIAIVCSQCSTVLHRHCYMRKNQFCPRCERLSRRAADQGSTVELSLVESSQEQDITATPEQQEQIPWIV